MKKILILVLLLMNVYAYAQTAATNVSAIAKRDLRESTLTGTGFELGLQHGKLLKKEIGEIVGKWKKNTSDMMGLDANIVLAEFFQYAQFTAAIQKWTPDLYEEIRGIAQGSGQQMNDIMVFNLLDEFWV